ncbi:MAG: beta-ketoacyl synthase N-terminal-like domain-containing protein [Gammaproteobacteria bacterium]|jgi:3-oxoacyl-[acyl-carrier-protein] synthase-1
MVGLTKQNRVVITGYGAIAATGFDVDTIWNAIKTGKSGIDKVCEWNIEDTECQLGAKIGECKLRDLIANRKLLKVIGRHDVFGLHAAQQALAHSNLLAYRDELSDSKAFNDFTGVYVGSPGNMYSQQYDFLPLLDKSDDSMITFGKNLRSEVHPMWLLGTLPNNVLAYIGIENGFKGPNENIMTHSSAGMQAVCEAAHAIQAGKAERAVVVGYTISLEPQSHIYYDKLGLLSNHGIKSFAANRDGTVLGEGAASLILESLESAEQRGAKIYGEILGTAVTCEATGVLAIDANGEGLKRVILKALAASQQQPQDIGMITAHANGLLNSDATEADSIRTIFGENSLPVTGFKWSFGHTLAASGILDIIMSIKSQQEQVVPAIATCEKIADDCYGINVSSQPQQPRSSSALIISRAFAGINIGAIIEVAPDGEVNN